MMIVFHFAYDLWYFRFVGFDIIHDTFWIYFRYVIVSIFLISVGVSLAIVHNPHIKWRKVTKRAVVLGGAAAMVTIATRIQAPDAWVYFGILHLIFVSSLLGLLFVHRPVLSIITALVVFVLSYFDITGQKEIFYWAQPIFGLPYRTEDLARFFPWFGAVLLGIAGYGFGWHTVLFNSPLLSEENSFNKTLAFMGRHALLIYLMHQPLLYGIVLLASKVINN